MDNSLNKLNLIFKILNKEIEFFPLMKKEHHISMNKTMQIKQVHTSQNHLHAILIKNNTSNRILKVLNFMKSIHNTVHWE
jgi:hypothetical protein